MRYLGSGQVEYTEERPVIHFGQSPEEVERIRAAHRLESAGWETTREAVTP